MLVTKSQNKKFVGKDIIHVAVFKKNDDRTIYNMIYRDNITNKTYVKRFPVKGVTRDKNYLLVNSTQSTVLYFSANTNGEAEIVSVLLRAKAKLKKLRLELDFASILIKNRSVKGNVLTNHSINRVELKSEGVSTLSGKKIWFDSSINRINDENRGDYLGEFSGDDKILIISSSGYYELLNYDLSTHFPDDMILIEKYIEQTTVLAVYFYASKKQFYIKRFKPLLKSKKTYFIDDDKESYLELVSSSQSINLELQFMKPRNKDARKNEIIKPNKFIDVKGVNAIGNQLSRYPVKTISIIENQKNIHQISSTQNQEIDSDNQIKLNF